jgi:hypothetical protein
MKRMMASTAAATLLAAGTAAPAFAAPRDCIQVERSCVAMDDVGENTEIYVGQNADGSMQGFTRFENFADWAGDTYGVTFSLRNGSIRVDLSSAGDGDSDRGDGGDRGGDGDSDGGDRGDKGDRGDRGGHGDRGDRRGNRDNRHRHGGGDDDQIGWSARKASFATFYDRSSLSGESFVVAPNETKDDLNDLNKPNGGDWNNEISSVRVTGGNNNAPGAVLCARVSCQQGGWVLILNNGDATQLTGGFNNSASFVGVFS